MSKLAGEQMAVSSDRGEDIRGFRLLMDTDGRRDKEPLAPIVGRQQRRSSHRREFMFLYWPNETPLSSLDTFQKTQFNLLLT